MTTFASGFDHGWSSNDGIATIWHEPTYNWIVIDTYNHDSEPASLTAAEARAAAAALLAFADLADATKKETPA